MVKLTRPQYTLLISHVLNNFSIYNCKLVCQHSSIKLTHKWRYLFKQFKLIERKFRVKNALYYFLKIKKIMGRVETNMLFI